MMFSQILFLWALAAVSIPIIIALWSTQKVQTIAFGGYFLLKRIFEARSRNLRLLELLKLINRVILLSLIILFFADPVSERPRLKEASNGFGILVDVGRSLQLFDEERRPLSELSNEAVTGLLNKISDDVRGSIFFVSDRCEPFRSQDGGLTASASQWRDLLKDGVFPFRNARTTSQALNECLLKMRGLFGKEDVFSVFVSPLPRSLAAETLSIPGLRIVALPRPQLTDWQPPELISRKESGMTQISLSSNDQAFDALLITTAGAENLGKFPGRLDLAPNQSVFVLHNQQAADSWAGYLFESVDPRISRRVVVWAERETDGFRSLNVALKKNPDVQVITEVGGTPSQSPVIIYGSFHFPLEQYPVAWIFAGPSSQTPLKIRDQKVLTQDFSTTGAPKDLRKSFTIAVPDGEILIRKYLLLDPDSYDAIESFQDGAPSLLRAGSTTQISPFDLEDLTTDLTLEATFIPYLYSRLESWLSSAVDREDPEGLARPLYLIPSVVKPHPKVIAEKAWPGVYQIGNQLQIVSPLEAPTEFHLAPSFSVDESTTSEQVSHQPLILRLIVVSALFELILCLIPFLVFRRAATAIILFVSIMAVVATPSSASDVKRRMPVGVTSEIDGDRRKSIEQLVDEIDGMSNLDFDSPKTVSPREFWSHALILFSQSKPLAPFSDAEREQIRSYAERGGLLFFDDPVATAQSSFFRSVEKELAKIFPGRPLKAISKDDVLFRTFFLLNEVSGRKLAEPSLFGVELDGRWVAVISSNDLLGAVLKSSTGDYVYSVTPYGISQRVLAERLLLNVFMYSAALNYKDDAIHLPHILKRRVR